MHVLLNYQSSCIYIFFSSREMGKYIFPPPSHAIYIYIYYCVLCQIKKITVVS
jgi:hypothetical protein